MAVSLSLFGACRAPPERALAPRAARAVKAESTPERNAAPAAASSASSHSKSDSHRILSIALGFAHSCVLIDSGDVRCWGMQQGPYSGPGFGEHLGDDETPDVARAIDLGGRALNISAGGGQTCALLDTGNVRCWGHGNLGYPGRNDAKLSPARLGDLDLGSRVIEISAGTDHQCARTELGTARCWGNSGHGELGYGSRRDIGRLASPASAGDVPLGERVVQVAAGRYQSCALLESSRVRCWGEAPLSGPIPRDQEEQARPADAFPLLDVGGKVRQIAVGGSVCALRMDGRVRCWGNNDHGQLGYGHQRRVATPANAGDVHVGGTVVQIAAGVAHVCVLLATGNVRCWGRGDYGSLGYGNGLDIGDDETLESAGDVPIGGRVVQIAAGGFHSCALLDTGKVRCWGNSVYGQLGYGDTRRIGDQESPAQVGDVRVFPEDPPTRSRSLWASQASPPNAPLTVAPRPSNDVAHPSVCAEHFPNCRALFDGRSLRVALETKPRRLSVRELSRYKAAYRQYLESAACLADDGAPYMDFRAIGSAQDPARVTAIVDAALTAPGRVQTMIVAFVGECAGEADDSSKRGKSLAILLENGELVSTTVQNGWDDGWRAAWARDLDGDGVAEVIGLARDGRDSNTGAISFLEVFTYAGGQAKQLAELDVDRDECAQRGQRTSFELRYGREAHPGSSSLCFQIREHARACPKGTPSSGSGGNL